MENEDRAAFEAWAKFERSDLDLSSGGRDYHSNATHQAFSIWLASAKHAQQKRDVSQERIDRAVSAAEEHFGEGAVRYKLSLFKNGRARNHFPPEIDGHWFALQRADNDAHVGLALQLIELNGECEVAKSKLRVANARIAELEGVADRDDSRPELMGLAPVKGKYESQSQFTQRLMRREEWQERMRSMIGNAK